MAPVDVTCTIIGSLTEKYTILSSQSIVQMTGPFQLSVNKSVGDKFAVEVRESGVTVEVAAGEAIVVERLGLTIENGRLF